MVNKDHNFISIADIVAALDELVSASEGLSFSNRLRTLVLVDVFLADPSLPKIEDAREFAVFYILTTTIREHYYRTRQSLDLVSLSDTSSLIEAKQAIIQDTQQNAAELLSWSYLYYCYVRVGLNIRLLEFSELAGIADRTVRRYRHKGFQRIYRILIAQEWEACSLQREIRLRAQLPGVASSILFGREGDFGIIQSLLAGNFAFNLFVSGASGIGKTSLIESYIRAYIGGRLPETPQIDQLIWISAPESPAIIYDTIDRQIYVENSIIGLQEYLLLYHCVIVIDNLGRIQEISSFIDDLLQLLHPAQVILINCDFIPSSHLTKHLVLNEITYDEMRLMIEYNTENKRQAENLDEYAINLLWDAVGGNPRSIRLAAEQLAMGDLLVSNFEISQLGLEENYRRLSEKAIRFFAALMLYPAFEPRISQVIELFGEMLYLEGFSELIRHHMVEVISLEPYLCKPLTLHIQYFQAIYTRHEANIVQIVEELLIRLQQKSSDYPHIGLAAIAKLLNEKWLHIESVTQERWMLMLLESGVNQHDDLWRITLQNLYQTRKKSLDIQLQIAYSVVMRRGCQWDEAHRILQYVIEKAGQGGNFKIQAKALIELGVVFRCQGDFNNALKTLEQSAATTIRLKDAKLTDRVSLELAQLAIDMMNGSQALDYLKHAEITRESLLLASEAYLLKNDIANCQAMAGKAALLSPDDRLFLARSHTVMGRSSNALEDYMSAHEHFSLAVAYLQNSNNLYGLARAQSNLASALINLQDHNIARRLLEDAIRTQKLIGDKLGEQLSVYNLEYLRRLSI